MLNTLKNLGGSRMRFHRIIRSTLFAAVAGSLSAAPSSSSEILKVDFHEQTKVERTYTDPFVGNFDIYEVFRDVSTTLGSPNFNAHRTTSTAIGDINGDLRPDLVDVNQLKDEPGAESVVLRLSTASGAFTADAIGVGGTPAYAELANLNPNTDSLADLILVDVVNQSVMVFLNQGAANGFFDLTATPDFQMTTSGCPGPIAVSDLNGDGADDFVVPQAINSYVFLDSPSLDATCVVASSVNRETQIFINRVSSPVPGTGEIFEVAQLTSDPNGEGDGSQDDTNAVILFKADDDSDVDLVNVNRGPYTIEFFLNTGNDAEGMPIFVSRQLLSTGTVNTGYLYGRAGAAADLDGDEAIDFVIGGQEYTQGAQGRARFDVYLSDGLNPPLYSDAGIGSPGAGSPAIATDIKIGDLEHDGDPEILASAYYTGTHNWYFQPEGTGRLTVFDFDPLATPGFEATAKFELFSPAASYTPDVSSIELADFDQDGDLDLYSAGGYATPVDDSLSPIQQVGYLPNQFYDNPGHLVHSAAFLYDVDSDGVTDEIDNCPNHANNQSDYDQDGMGDACDWIPVFNPDPSTIEIRVAGALIEESVNLKSGTPWTFFTTIDDPDGVEEGFAVYAWLGNTTKYTYIWHTGDAYTGYPPTIRPTTPNLTMTFTLLPGEPERVFFATLNVIDDIGDYTRKIIEIHVTP